MRCLFQSAFEGTPPNASLCIRFLKRKERLKYNMCAGALCPNGTHMKRLYYETYSFKCNWNIRSNSNLRLFNQLYLLLFRKASNRSSRSFLLTKFVGCGRITGATRGVVDAILRMGLTARLAPSMDNLIVMHL